MVLLLFYYWAKEMEIKCYVHSFIGDEDDDYDHCGKIVDHDDAHDRDTK